MSKERRIAELAMQIGSLRERLQNMERELIQLMPNGTQDAAQRIQRDRGMVAGSIAARIVQLLEANPTSAFDAPSVSQQLGIENVNSLRGTLLRLADTNRIRKVSRGSYGAARSGTT